MLDAVTLDQLRIFVAAADEGSFSAAGRKLGRAQSVVSDAVAALEAQFGVTLFDRSRRSPRPTEAGRVLLADARGIVGDIDRMKARARGMAGGLEAELSLVLDVFVPMEAFAGAARDFRAAFPGMPLRLYVEALGAVVPPLLDGRAMLGIAGPQTILPASLVHERVTEITFVMVAAPSHPLAGIAGRVSREEAARHAQLVLTDRTAYSGPRDVGVMTPHTWRLADLFAKHAFLLNGLGWGGMPYHAVRADLDAGRLVRLDVEGNAPQGQVLPLYAVYPAARPPGPAGRWMIERIAAFGIDVPPSLARG